MITSVHTAPENSGYAVRGKTLTQLLYEAEADSPNPKALNQPRRGGKWESWSTERFRREAEELARGLIDIGLEPGAHVATFMESDVYFCLIDMGCLVAGLIDVPIYLTHKDEQIRYVLEHSESKVLAVSRPEHVEQVARLIGDLPHLTHVLLAEAAAETPTELPGHIELISFDDLRERGRRLEATDSDALAQRRDAIKPSDLATIIYTSGTTGAPKGVMLTHENISFDALTSFSGLQDYVSGVDGEVAVSFLPLTHIFARALHYGFVATGTSVYFTTPDELGTVLKDVRPTVFASVPRLLEKVYGRILERAQDLSGIQKVLLQWSIDLAGDFELGVEPPVWWKVRHRIADALVYKKWRQGLGGRAKYIIAGGAALSGHLANTFAAAGVTVLQGYGLTETSPVITYNRPNMNRAGTVGVPIPGVEVGLTEEGEIVTRGPHVMVGYYKDEERTGDMIDEDGWLHTGDIGEFTDEGYLKITDRKKDLFKLSTGKYVTPQPLESDLTANPLIEQAVVVGAGHKFCTALIFPDQDALRAFARNNGLARADDVESLIDEPAVRQRLQELVDRANVKVDYWSEIKRFAIIPAHLTPENGMLTPTMKVRRAQVRKTFEKDIRALYEENPEAEGPSKTALVTD
jgi:long-chain acyl-CoA synthetase